MEGSPQNMAWLSMPSYQIDPGETSSGRWILSAPRMPPINDKSEVKLELALPNPNRYQCR